MSKYTKRIPLNEHVDIKEVQPVVERLVKKHGDVYTVADALEAQGFKISRRHLERILQGVTKGVKPQTYEGLCIAADMEPNPTPYRQRIYRVQGFDPWNGNFSVRYWYYVSKADARRRKKMLEERHCFIEWSTCVPRWETLTND